MTEDFADQVILQINGVRRVLRRRLRGTLDGLVFTASQVELLQLVEASRGVSVSAAARELRLAANSVSTLVNQLAEAGYLHRGPDPRDRRAARLFLTEAATARLAAWREARTRLLDAGLSELSADDRDAIARALPALGRLADAVAEVRI